MQGLYLWGSYFPSVETEGRSDNWRHIARNDKEYKRAAGKLITAAQRGQEGRMVIQIHRLLEKRQELLFVSPTIEDVYAQSLDTLYHTYGEMIEHIQSQKNRSQWREDISRKKMLNLQRRQAELADEIGNFLVSSCLTTDTNSVQRVSQSCKRFFAYDFPLV